MYDYQAFWERIVGAYSIYSTVFGMIRKTLMRGEGVREDIISQNYNIIRCQRQLHLLLVKNTTISRQIGYIFV